MEKLQKAVAEQSGTVREVRQLLEADDQSFLFSESRQGLKEVLYLDHDLENENLPNVTMALMQMQRMVRTGPHRIFENPPKTAYDDAKPWLLQEMGVLLVACHEASAASLKQEESFPKLIRAASSCSNNRQPQKAAVVKSVALERNLYRLRYVHTTSFIQVSPQGVFSLRIFVCSSGDTSQYLLAILTFTPTIAFCDKGVTVKLLKPLEQHSDHSIPRSLTVFNVMHYPSAIFNAVEGDRVAEVQRLFSTRQASPNDRSSCGVSLLEASKVLPLQYSLN